MVNEIISSEYATNIINDITDKAEISYYKLTGKSMNTDVLKPDDWFSDRVTKAKQKFNREMNL